MKRIQKGPVRGISLKLQVTALFSICRGRLVECIRKKKGNAEWISFRNTLLWTSNILRWDSKRMPAGRRDEDLGGQSYSGDAWVYRYGNYPRSGRAGDLANFVIPQNSVVPYWTWCPRQIPQPPCLLNCDVTGCFIKESMLIRSQFTINRAKPIPAATNVPKIATTYLIWAI